MGENRFLYASGAQFFQTSIHGDGRAMEPPVGESRIVLQYQFVVKKIELAEQRRSLVVSRVNDQTQYHNMGAGPPVENVYPTWESDLQAVLDEIEELEVRRDELQPALPRNTTQQDYNYRRSEKKQTAQETQRRLNQILSGQKPRKPKTKKTKKEKASTNGKKS